MSQPDGREGRVDTSPFADWTGIMDASGPFWRRHMAVEHHAHSAFRFGRFELDLRSRELRKDGVRLRLQDQPLALLAMLLERPSEVLTRDDLRRRLWPEGTFVDFEHGLNAAVKRLRAVLGDNAERPRFVETLPRRGYRFIAKVERVNGHGAFELSPARDTRQRLAVLPFTTFGEASVP